MTKKIADDDDNDEEEHMSRHALALLQACGDAGAPITVRYAQLEKFNNKLIYIYVHVYIYIYI